MIRDNGRFIRSVLPDLIHRVPLLNQMRESILPMIGQYLEKIAAYGKARGELGESVDPNMMMLQLMGFILTYTMFTQDQTNARRDVEQAVKNMMEGWNNACKS
jgi:hypothetical protein